MAENERSPDTFHVQTHTEGSLVLSPEQQEQPRNEEEEEEEDEKGNEASGAKEEEGSEKKPGEEGNPLLFVDVNLGPGRADRIVVYEGDTAESLAERFSQEHGKLN